MSGVRVPLGPPGFFVAMTRISRKPKIPFQHSPSTSVFNMPPPHPVFTCLVRIQFQRFRAQYKRHSVKCIRGEQESLWGRYPKCTFRPNVHFAKRWSAARLGDVHGLIAGFLPVSISALLEFDCLLVTIPTNRCDTNTSSCGEPAPTNQLG